MTAPDFGLPTTESVDPVEVWLAANRCCGAPQLCGARCMDDEDSATGARVARELDDARGRIVELEGKVEAVRELVRTMRAQAAEADEAAATFARRDDAHVDLRRRAAIIRTQAGRIAGALGEEL